MLIFPQPLSLYDLTATCNIAPQSDAHRQNSRIAELDALNCTLRTQMDMAMNNETDLGR